jgi:pimeloyl-ACP methyl ester carboxylesterase
MSYAPATPASLLPWRILHACCSTAAVMSVFFTGFRTLKSSGDEAWDILGWSAGTLVCAHLAWWLGDKAIADPRQRNRALVVFAMVAGYICAARGVSDLCAGL